MTQKMQEGAGVISADEAINVAFAEIAVQELGYTEDGPDADTYGLSEKGLEHGGRLMVEKVNIHYISREEHDRRVTELLETANRYLAQRRALRACMEWAMQLIPESLSGVNQEMRKAIGRLFQ